jgi:hypothetical protein
MPSTSQRGEHPVSSVLRDNLEVDAHRLEHEDVLRKQIEPKVCEVTQVASSIIETDAKSLKVPVTLL